jgi:hypothetical protein
VPHGTVGRKLTAHNWESPLHTNINKGKKWCKNVLRPNRIFRSDEIISQACISLKEMHWIVCRLCSIIRCVTTVLFYHNLQQSLFTELLTLYDIWRLTCTCCYGLWSILDFNPEDGGSMFLKTWVSANVWNPQDQHGYFTCICILKFLRFTSC